jgi:hypothetical protein
MVITLDDKYNHLNYACQAFMQNNFHILVTTFNIKIMQILALQHCPRDFLSDFDYEDA